MPPFLAGKDFDPGENFDGMAQILRIFDHHLDYKAPYDAYLEVADVDEDQLADQDNRLVLDELRFGSNPSMPDSDGDGLKDLDEFTAAYLSGSNPNDNDTDGDGTSDAEDIYPITDFKSSILKTEQVMTIDGIHGC